MSDIAGTERDLRQRVESLSARQRELLERRLQEKRRTLPWLARPEAAAGGATARPARARRTRRPTSRMDFSLFFFSSDGSIEGSGKYRMLLDCARYADTHGYDGIWVPERHFVDFGGLYPNPSLLAAAIAAVTERLPIRAGSVVVPLHHPVRIAEEWSVVDNLSGGRVSVSCASGWHPDDFVLAPDPSPERYTQRRTEMFDQIELVRRLWRGEAVPMRRPDGETVRLRSMPRPLQPELPVWISSSGNVETFVQAGKAGAHVLTGLVAQQLPDLGEKIAAYRAALRDSGHDPERGKVGAMVHTFVGTSDDEVRDLVRRPLIDYLTTFLAQQESFGSTYSQMDAAEREAMLNAMFDRYFDTIALLGTPDKCETLIEDLVDIGVDEVACLVDFGVDDDRVRDSLDHLTELKRRYAGPRGDVR
ncbi:MupA/Atu3671 family FMN-dependent luciferase-like monooxygenase [Streptomyces sp. NPDC102451]|uniref:MupA/Atu3671 family FMN-dependent luciferase-like monooxygenase n=1 Tax=Streptomyces sp. NPDC102451 TaxID=3366177 RepID=UPI0038154F30